MTDKIRTMAASLLDRLAGLLELPARGTRWLAGLLRGGGPGEEDER